MKYLKTFEQISQGKEVTILMTKDRKYFVSNHEYTEAFIGDYDYGCCLYMIDSTNDLSQSHMKGTEKSTKIKLDEINESDITITCVKRNSIEYDGYIKLSDNVKEAFHELMEEDILDQIIFNLFPGHTEGYSNYFSDLIKHTDFQLNDGSAFKRFELEPVKFFVGFQELDDEGMYIDI